MRSKPTAIRRISSFGPQSTWPTIDGNWGGYRRILADLGRVFPERRSSICWGNVSGQARAFAPADSSLLAVDGDLERLAAIKGLLLHAEFVAIAGENLSAKSIGNTLQVATAFAQPGYYLGQMYAQQKLFGEL
jgi:hypothetical protein